MKNATPHQTPPKLLAKHTLTHTHTHTTPKPPGNNNNNNSTTLSCSSLQLVSHNHHTADNGPYFTLPSCPFPRNLQASTTNTLLLLVSSSPVSSPNRLLAGLLNNSGSGSGSGQGSGSGFPHATHLTCNSVPDSVCIVHQSYPFWTATPFASRSQYYYFRKKKNHHLHHHTTPLVGRTRH
ncbi:hypothetical protein M758_5G068500 [Ceratodon purpureus]|nr:hypothetical protein M758_5G068500 [Ceratodon purpureus]